MSPNEKSVRLHAIVAALEECRKEAVRLGERMVGYALATATRKAREAAEKAIARACASRS